MDNNLENDKEERKQLQKEFLEKIESFLKRRWKIILLALVAFWIIIGLAGSSDLQEGVEKGREMAEKKEDNKEEIVKEPEPEVVQDSEEGNSEPLKVKIEEKKVEAPTPENKQTTSQKSAIKTAENYLRIKGFSRSGLIEQLKFEQFSEADATYAVDNIKIDYNEQAKKSADSYMSIKGFSRGGLIDQLKFEGFTQSQAEYGADSVGL